MKQILINSEELQTRVAVVEDGILQDFFMERDTADRMVGSIYRGCIRNLEPSLQAAFVDIGHGKNAFLHYWDMIPATQDMLENDGGDEDELLDDEEEEIEEAPAPVKAAPSAEDSGKGFFARLLNLFCKEDVVQVPVANKVTREATREAPRVAAKSQHQQRGRRQQKQAKAPSLEDIPNLFKPGQEILVQVTKGPIGTKGARVTTNLSIAGRYLVLLPNSEHTGVSKRVEEKAERDRLRKMMRTIDVPRGMGLICRTVGANCTSDHFQRDLDYLLDRWNGGKGPHGKKAPVCVYQEPDLAERSLRDCLTEDVDEIVTDSEAVFKRAQELVQRYNVQGKVKIKMYANPTPLFNKYGLAQQLLSIFNRKVTLPSGGYICIDETEALIAIDVNTGKNRTGKDQPETIMATNLEAVEEIARQLRLRNVGGLVVLDLIDMKQKKDQMTVYRTLKEKLSRDRARTRVCQISQLGLLEMTRQRENESLESTMFDDCPYCKGRGLVKSATSMSVEIQRKINEILARKHYTHICVYVHPRILERLKNEDKKLFTGIEHEYRTIISFEADNMFHVEDFQITDATTGQNLQ